MSRLINRQRQLAEQGRLRLGYTVPIPDKPGKSRPVRSETWVITSHSREHVETAATLWGGDVHEWEPMGNGAKQWRVITQAKVINAILPPGDPLTQAYETWSKGGCQRRCDGVTEQFSGSPCLCIAEFGEQWYEQRNACDSKSRLKVLLPDMPGLGSWRMDTGSFYATDEIAGMVDTIRGAVGSQVLVPVALRIEPRTRVAGGQTKQFVVPVLELRGVTAGALLSGEATRSGSLMLNDPTKTPRELASGMPDAYAPYFDLLEAAETVEDLQVLWQSMITDNLVGSHSEPSQRRVDFVEAYKAKGALVKPADPAAEAPPAAAAQPDADGAVDADVVDDGEAVWQQILAITGKRGWTLSRTTADFSERMEGLVAAEATSGELGLYLEKLAADETAEPVAS